MPRHAEQSQSRQSGFSLLEILVVLVLIGAVAGLTVPRVVSMYDSMEWGFERDDALEALGSLGYEAWQQGREFDLVSYPGTLAGNMTMGLPEGWSLSAKRPIRYKSNGICLGGTVALTGRGRSFTVTLKSPKCRPEMER